MFTQIKRVASHLRWKRTGRRRALAAIHRRLHDRLISGQSHNATSADLFDRQNRLRTNGSEIWRPLRIDANRFRALSHDTNVKLRRPKGHTHGFNTGKVLTRLVAACQQTQNTKTG